MSSILLSPIADAHTVTLTPEITTPIADAHAITITPEMAAQIAGARAELARLRIQATKIINRLRTNGYSFGWENALLLTMLAIVQEKDERIVQKFPQEAMLSTSLYKDAENFCKNVDEKIGVCAGVFGDECDDCNCDLYGIPHHRNDPVCIHEDEDF